MLKFSYLSKIIALSLIFILSNNSFAQEKGVLSGNFYANFNAFLTDSAIGAVNSNSPQYGKDYSSAEAWLFLNYRFKGFDFALRYDAFNNSNLLITNSSFTGQGLGFWSISKSIDNFNITVGNFYDQFGSGLVFRSFENRLIGLDNAMRGVKLEYHFKNIVLKGFTGQMRKGREERFEYYEDVLKGLNAEYFKYLKSGISLNIGASVVNRTLTDESMSPIVSEINGLSNNDLKFEPRWNAFAYNGYLTSNWKSWTLSAEYVGKTPDPTLFIPGPYSDSATNIYKESNGYIANVELGYARRRLGKNKKGGLGINVKYREINEYDFRNAPGDGSLDGVISFQSAMSHQNTYRLLARYNSPAQALGERGYYADLQWTFNKKRSFNLNLSRVELPDGNMFQFNGNTLYFERYLQFTEKFNNRVQMKLGVQLIDYNQEIYEQKPDYKLVKTVTPFGEVSYQFNPTTSLRVEAQYLETTGDLGSFFNAVAELTISPKYSFAISDMVNTKPVRQSTNPLVANRVLHYPTVFAKYNIKTTSFSLSYIKQVEGVNCTGGICRLEPAFSGVRFTVSSVF